VRSCQGERSTRRREDPLPPEIVYRLQGEWRSFTVEGDEITIGRDARNDLVIENRSVSRKHAKLRRTSDGWRVTDVGSRYGTRINDLGHANAVLRSGDKIYLHKLELTFIDDEAAGASLTAKSGAVPEPGLETVFHDTVDFSSLAAAPRDLVRLQKLLAVVTKASRAILVSDSLDDTFGRVLQLVLEQLPVQRGFIMLWDEEKQDFVTKCVRHQDPGAERGAPIRFSRTIAERVYRDRVAVITTDARKDGRFADGASIMELGIRSAMAAPLWRGEEVDGLIYADSTVLAQAFDSFDLDILSALGNHLAVAIEQARLQQSVVEQKIVRRRLERYHSPAVVDRITTDRGGTESLFAEERDVTVLFADVVGFTARCETMEPRAVAELLNRHFSEMTEVVFRYEGTLDKFIGDCLMAVFGAPMPTEDHARRAVDAALEMRTVLERLNDPLKAEDRTRFRVGIHSGRVVAGDIGSLRRSDYTVLGNTVNLAARLESSVARPGQIVISDATLEGLGQGYAVRFVGEHQPRGVSKPVRCFEVVGRESEGATTP
jgi:adenylate cyclase